MLKLPTLTERRELLCMRFYKKNLCDTSSKLSELWPHPTYHEHNLRHVRNIPVFKCHTKVEAPQDGGRQILSSANS